MNLISPKNSLISEIRDLSKNIIRQSGKNNIEIAKSIKEDKQSMQLINPYNIFNLNLKKMIESSFKLRDNYENIFNQRDDIIDERRELLKTEAKQDKLQEETADGLIQQIKDLKKLLPILTGLPPAPSAPTSPGATPTNLGTQGSAPGENLGSASRTLESGKVKGYIIMPGHLTGDGAPGEPETVKKLAKRLYDRVKSEVPNVPVVLNMNNFGGDFEKQKAWVQSKENEGWEVLEIHMDATIESGYGTGRGIVPARKGTSEFASLYAPTYGSYGRGHRGGLALPNRGADLIELGNQTPQVTQLVNQNNDVNAMDTLIEPVVKIFKLMSQRIR